MSKFLPILLAVVAGLSLATQQLVNANLRTALSSPAWAGFASYFVGTLCMAGLTIVLRDPVPSMEVAAAAPWWSWLGGLLGAIFIGLAIILVPRLGAGTFFALLITGQMIGSIVFDHFGLFGLLPRPAELMRLVGVIFLITGVVLIRR
jgi:transporter family-2 protein